MIRRIATDIVINQRETDEESPVCGDLTFGYFKGCTNRAVFIAHPAFLTIIIRSILVIYTIMLKLKIINKTRNIQK